MKEIVAVIRMNMVNETKHALAEAGYPAFFASEAQGRGKGLINTELLRGAENGVMEAAELLGEKGRLYPKRIFTLVVHDDQVEEAVDTIVSVNQTKKPGDGKIFVVPIEDAMRVRTRERSNKAID